jgi:hypothetical protein
MRPQFAMRIMEEAHQEPLHLEKADQFVDQPAVELTATSLTRWTSWSYEQRRELMLQGLGLLRGSAKVGPAFQ